MVKQSLIFLFVITFFFATPVKAESPTPTTSTNTNYRLQVKEARENQIETREQTREEFQTRLQEIKDEKKRKIVENISNRIAAINQNRTTIMANHLNRIESILNKVKTRTATAKTNGKNVIAVESSITIAEANLASARQKVTDQSSKQYVINITSEATLGTAVAAARQTFQADLKIAHDSVVMARQSTATAIQALAQVLGETITNQ